MGRALHEQAWGQVHFKILEYKYFETFASTSTASYPQQVFKYFIQYLSTSISTFEIKASLHICSK